MEGSMSDKQRLEAALRNAGASHAKLMREHPDFIAANDSHATTAPKTLEELFGRERATEMRREAELLRMRDGDIDK